MYRWPELFQLKSENLMYKDVYIDPGQILSLLYSIDIQEFGIIKSETRLKRCKQLSIYYYV